MAYSKKPSSRGKIYVINAIRNCEPSSYLFNQVLNFFRLNGYEVTDKILDSKAIVINTCGVSKAMMDRSMESIREALFYKDHVEKIVFFGCAAKIADLSGIPKEVILVGPKEIDSIDDCFSHDISISKAHGNILEPGVFETYQKKIQGDDFFVSLCQGCTNCCSYCNIKKAKGSPQSRQEEDILGEIRAGIESGRREFTLVAEDCGSYGTDTGTDVVELAEKIFSMDDRIKIRIVPIFPGRVLEMEERLIKVVRAGIISYIGMPLQSGSQRILGLMNRGYDLKEIRRVIKRIREASPDIWLNNNIIVGFPTETEEEFRQSVDISKLYDETVFLMYADHRGTAAEKIFPKVGPTQREKRKKMIEEALEAGDIRGSIAVL